MDQKQEEIIDETCNYADCVEPAVAVVNGWYVCEDHIPEAEHAQNKYTMED
jgi:hypothetical protein